MLIAIIFTLAGAYWLYTMNKGYVELIRWPLTLAGGAIGLFITGVISFPALYIADTEDYVYKKTSLDKVPYYEDQVKNYSYLVWVGQSGNVTIYYSPKDTFIVLGFNGLSDIEERKDIDEAFFLQYKKRFKSPWLKFLFLQINLCTINKFVIPEGETKQFIVR
jgi:hypothetical protein